MGDERKSLYAVICRLSNPELGLNSSSGSHLYSSFDLVLSIVIYEDTVIYKSNKNTNVDNSITLKRQHFSKA